MYNARHIPGRSYSGKQELEALVRFGWSVGSGPVRLHLYVHVYMYVSIMCARVTNHVVPEYGHVVFLVNAFLVLLC